LQSGALLALGLIMSETTQDAAAGEQQWDDVVAAALAASGVNGTVVLSGSRHRISVPFGLSALLSAVLHFVAPSVPRRLRIYTYDVLHIGSLLEVRGARELAALPSALVKIAADLGLTVNLSPLAGSSSVLLTLREDAQRPPLT
jgi:hypothetical protein